MYRNCEDIITQAVIALVFVTLFNIHASSSILAHEAGVVIKLLGISFVILQEERDNSLIWLKETG